jgi:hypothetical protein
MSQQQPSDQSESPVYVFEVQSEHDLGDPTRGQKFDTQKEALRWIVHQPANKKFVMLTVISGGGEKP